MQLRLIELNSTQTQIDIRNKEIPIRKSLYNRFKEFKKNKLVENINKKIIDPKKRSYNIYK